MPVTKEVYEMHGGIPIWKHLMNNGEVHKTNLNGNDYGRLAEWVGKRELRKLTKFEKFLNNLFPGIEILSTSRRTKISHYSLEYGDYCVEISYKHGNSFGKKVLIVEIKHGKIEISQQQIRRYSNYIINPSAYFRKADEVKVIFMLFTEINTMNATASYSLCEFSKKFANKIIDAMPKRIETDGDNNSHIFSIFEVHESQS